MIKCVYCPWYRSSDEDTKKHDTKCLLLLLDYVSIGLLDYTNSTNAMHLQLAIINAPSEPLSAERTLLVLVAHGAYLFSTLISPLKKFQN